MSDEKIQIEIQDKVAPSIENKLTGIAGASRVAHDHIERLKSALRTIDSSAITALARANTLAMKAINDNALASQRLRTEEQRTQQQTLNAATAQQKLQTAATATATAQQALAAATARATAAESVQAREAANAAAAQTRAASAALRLQQQQERLARSSQDLTREGEQLKRTLNPLYDAHQRYNSEVARANLLHREGAIDMQTYNAALSAAKGRLESTAAATRSLGAA